MWKKLLARGRQLWRVSLGAGIFGALVLSVRYALRPSAKPKLPDAISPAIFATRLMYTSRGQLVYHESGRGAPLLFVHGIYLGASSYEWSKVYPHFARSNHVLAVDLLGFGESERPDIRLAASDHVRVLTELIRTKFGGERVSIVASGLTAGFATVLAAQHPELVQRLILFVPAGRADSGRGRFPIKLAIISRVPFVNRAFYRRYLSTRIYIRAWLRSFGFADPEKVSDETIEVLTNFAQQFGADRAILQSFSGRFDLDLEENLADVIQPVTLCWGEKCSNLEFGYRLRTIARHCSMVVLPNSGLLAALESPSQVTATLMQELDATIRVFKA
ncbi:MAG TPA: alpha/beta hydrolase [Chthoniobacterales bacterium]|nr:alpha/beta hydrolase [Chthoniobacterales bacterium]